jgi:hypothetical protein
MTPLSSVVLGCLLIGSTGQDLFCPPVGLLLLHPAPHFFFLRDLAVFFLQLLSSGYVSRK